MIAFASLILNDSIYLGSIGIHKKLDGTNYRITYPTKKIGDKSINIYHPINKTTSRLIEQALIKEVKKLFI